MKPGVFNRMTMLYFFAIAALFLAASTYLWQSYIGLGPANFPEAPRAPKRIIPWNPNSDQIREVEWEYYRDAMQYYTASIRNIALKQNVRATRATYLLCVAFALFIINALLFVLPTIRERKKYSPALGKHSAEPGKPPTG